MKKTILVAMVILMLVPMMKVNYYSETEGMVEKRQSIVTIVVQSIVDGTVGTKLF